MPSKEPPSCQYEIFVVNNTNTPILYSLHDDFWCRVNTNSFAKITADALKTPRVKPVKKGVSLITSVTCTDKVLIVEVYN